MTTCTMDELLTKRNRLADKVYARLRRYQGQFELACRDGDWVHAEQLETVCNYLRDWLDELDSTPV